MRHYTISRVTGAPDWSSIPCLDVDNYQWLPKLDIQMKAQICYDPEGLHVHLRAWEKNIRSEHTEPLSMVCEDSCMEFFVRPVAEDIRYFNIEMNPNGRTYLGFGPNMDGLVRLAPENEEELMQKKTARLEDGWEVYYTIPVSFIRTFFPGYELTPGRTLYANCYKCGDLTVQPHFISWNPVELDAPSFHQPQFFGEMVLG